MGELKRTDVSVKWFTIQNAVPFKMLIPKINENVLKRQVFTPILWSVAQCGPQCGFCQCEVGKSLVITLCPG